MPLPTDRVAFNRTFRQCAGDPVLTEYHTQRFMTQWGLATLTIYRGPEALEASLSLPPDGWKPIVASEPVTHGPYRLFPTPDKGVSSVRIQWGYDRFGDKVFSSLKSGAYKDMANTEWSVQEVLDDSIDEIRRVLGLNATVTMAAPKPTPVAPSAPPTPGTPKRRLAL